MKLRWAFRNLISLNRHWINHFMNRKVLWTPRFYRRHHCYPKHMYRVFRKFNRTMERITICPIKIQKDETLRRESICQRQQIAIAIPMMIPFMPLAILIQKSITKIKNNCILMFFLVFFLNSSWNSNLLHQHSVHSQKAVSFLILSLRVFVLSQK